MREGSDLNPRVGRVRTCGPSLVRRVRRVAGRRLTAPEVPASWSIRRWTSRYARCLSPVGSRLAPEISLAPLMSLALACERKYAAVKVAPRGPWRRGGPRSNTLKSQLHGVTRAPPGLPGWSSGWGSGLGASPAGHQWPPISGITDHISKKTPTPASSRHPGERLDCVTAEVSDVWWKW